MELEAAKEGRVKVQAGRKKVQMEFRKRCERGLEEVIMGERRGVFVRDTLVSCENHQLALMAFL